MATKPNIHFVVHEERDSGRSRRSFQASIFVEPAATLQNALTAMLGGSALPPSQYEVLRATSTATGKPAKFGEKVADQQSFEVVIRRKRQRAHRSAGARISSVSAPTFKVVRTVVQEIVDEIPLRSCDPQFGSSFRPHDGFDFNSEASTSKITIHLLIKTSTPKTFEFVDEYPWVKLSNHPFRVAEGTTAIQFISGMIKKGLMNEVVEFKRLSPDQRPTEVGMNEILEDGQRYSLVIKEGIPKYLDNDDPKAKDLRMQDIHKIYKYVTRRRHKHRSQETRINV